MLAWPGREEKAGAAQGPLLAPESACPLFQRLYLNLITLRRHRKAWGALPAEAGGRRRGRKRRGRAGRWWVGRWKGKKRQIPPTAWLLKV